MLLLYLIAKLPEVFDMGLAEPLGAVQIEKNLLKYEIYAKLYIMYHVSVTYQRFKSNFKVFSSKTLL